MRIQLYTDQQGKEEMLQNTHNRYMDTSEQYNDNMFNLLG